MRSIWNGTISFGLVSIPIKIFNATETHAVSFRQIHTADGGRIRYKKVCELDEEEVPSSEIGKAYEDADGTVVPITDEDLAALPLPTAKTVEIVAFVPESSIDPLQVDKAYYLQANGVPAAKPYTLLREALRNGKRVALAKFALRGRERLGMLRVVDEAIAMHALLWPDEMRAPSGVAPEGKVTVRDAELDLADALMDTLGEVDMDELHDDYREALEELITAKAAGAMPEAPEGPAEAGGQVIDLMAALESSVRAARASRGGGEAAAEVTRLSTRERAAAGKKGTARTPKAPEGKKSTGGGAAKRTAPARKSTSRAGADGGDGGKANGKKSAAAKKTAAKRSAGKTASAASGGKTPAKKSSQGRRASA
ncbi:Ku protein [Streptomyces sp. GC420]|uniref:non-homologous end joining protein Ku n=1 Tax=Streptomyces sp. GC420 TaxID=2697568 RepID=UPI0014152434|nr:Ku protein [Streptomyces sp. GC420]NBM17779.1 Ku protein [Streptomyces sp. GC420]